MQIYLKMKIKSLASESRIIRQAERHIRTKFRALYGKYPKRHKKGEPKPEMPKFVKRADDWGNKLMDEGKEPELQAAIDAQYAKYWGLEHHRKNVVRKAARHALLAYGFLRGKTYIQIESKGCYTLPDFEEVERIAIKFSQEDVRVTAQHWAEWKDRAESALNIGVAPLVAKEGHTAAS